MSYTVHFTGTRADRIREARQECKNYLGAARYKKVVKVARDILLGAPRRAKGYRELSRSLALFVGIRGRWCVRAIAEDALK